MARRTTEPPEPVVDRIVDVDVTAEMQSSFLEYAYSVIYSRALPDARDGLKPVQRRILYTMAEMGLRPDRGHVKSARVVGEVMGKLHPHGDAAIYDALVRMAQPFSLRLPLVDGHGNFGSLDEGPAAYRYTECRLAPAALAMVAGLDEEVVDFGPNYDGRETEPLVLPAAFPNLLVNGASGIAVGMATNMAPHNLGEVVAAARHLLAHPEASVSELMRFVPGPDLPSGGRIVGLAGIREAYETGRGSFRMRATARVEQLTARRSGIVVTELPWNVGPEKVIERIRELHNAKKLSGIAAVTDYTDGEHGLELVIELKSGFVPEAVLEQLYRMTPLEESFGINNVTLVDGQPRTLGLKELLEVYLAHRLEVVRRRCQFRRGRAADRLHLVEGLLVAILDIDEVIAVIRSSEDTADARTRLMSVFDLTEIQANYILEMPLRRLTKYSRIELEAERDELAGTIAELDRLLSDESALRDLVATELAEVSAAHATPRRTVLLEGAVAVRGAAPAVALELTDDPCEVLLSSTGLIARRAVAGSVGAGDPAGMDPGPATGAGGGAVGPRGMHDVVVARALATVRGDVGVVTSHGRIVRAHVQDLPGLPAGTALVSVAGGVPLGGCRVAGSRRDGGGAGQPASRGGSAHPGHGCGHHQAGRARATAEQGGLGGHPARRGRPGGRRTAGRRLGRAGAAQRRRAAAALPGCVGPSAGAHRRRHGGHQADRGSARDRVRRVAPGRAGRGDHGGLGLRGPGRCRRLAEGDHRVGLSREGPGDRRRAGAPVPQGRGHPLPGLDHHVAGGCASAGEPSSCPSRTRSVTAPERPRPRSPVRWPVWSDRRPSMTDRAPIMVLATRPASEPAPRGRGARASVPCLA